MFDQKRKSKIVATWATICYPETLACLRLQMIPSTCNTYGCPSSFELIARSEGDQTTPRAGNQPRGFGILVEVLLCCEWNVSWGKHKRLAPISKGRARMPDIPNLHSKRPMLWGDGALEDVRY